MVSNRRWELVFCAVAGISSFGPALVGQRTAWQVPVAGAVEYQRQGQAKASATCTSKQAAKTAPLQEALPARYLRQLPPAPLLCQGELRSDRRALDGAVADLRDILRAVSFDLSWQSAS